MRGTSFAGEFTAPGTPRDVYEFLVDPRRLVTCLPDLKQHEIQDEDHFTVTLRVGLGVVGGPMTMKLEIAEKTEGTHARILGKGKMLGSQVSIDGNFALSQGPDGATMVAWTGNAKLGGYITHLVGGALDRLVQEHLERFVQELEAALTKKQ